MQRLYVGGLSHTITQKDLKDRFGKFGGVEDVELRTRKDDDGVPYKTFAYINMKISDTDLKKCMTVLNKSKWKGGTLQIEPAKESFLHRLAQERQAESQRPQQPAECPHSQKVLESLSQAGVDNFTMKAAVPGTEIPGHKDWVVSKFGRVLPVLQLKGRKGNKSRTLKYDPSKYCHNIRRLAQPDVDHPTPVTQLTWEVDGGDDDISRKRRGEFPAYKSPRPKKSRTDAVVSHKAVSTSRPAQPVVTQSETHQLTNGFKAVSNPRPPQKRGPRFADSDVDSEEEIRHLVALQQPSHDAVWPDGQDENLEVVGCDYLNFQKQQQHAGRPPKEEEDYDSDDTDELFASRKPPLPPTEKLPQPNADNILERTEEKKKKAKRKTTTGEEEDSSGKAEFAQRRQKQELNSSSVNPTETTEDEDSDYSDSDYEAMFSNVTHLEISLADLQNIAEQVQETPKTPTPAAKLTPARKHVLKKGILPEEILASLLKGHSSDDEQKRKNKALPAFQGTRKLNSGSQTDKCGRTIIKTPDPEDVSESSKLDSELGEDTKDFNTPKVFKTKVCSPPKQTETCSTTDEDKEDNDMMKTSPSIQSSSSASHSEEEEDASQEEEERQRKDNTKRPAAVVELGEEDKAFNTPQVLQKASTKACAPSKQTETCSTSSEEEEDNEMMKTSPSTQSSSSSAEDAGEASSSSASHSEEEEEEEEVVPQKKEERLRKDNTRRPAAVDFEVDLGEEDKAFNTPKVLRTKVCTPSKQTETCSTSGEDEEDVEIQSSAEDAVKASPSAASHSEEKEEEEVASLSSAEDAVKASPSSASHSEDKKEEEVASSSSVEDAVKASPSSASHSEEEEEEEEVASKEEGERRRKDNTRRPAAVDSEVDLGEQDKAFNTPKVLRTKVCAPSKQTETCSTSSEDEEDRESQSSVEGAVKASPSSASHIEEEDEEEEEKVEEEEEEEVASKEEGERRRKDNTRRPAAADSEVDLGEENKAFNTPKVLQKASTQVCALSKQTETSSTSSEDEEEDDEIQSSSSSAEDAVKGSSSSASHSEDEEEEEKVAPRPQLSAQEEEERQRKDNTRRLAAVQQRQKEAEELKKLIQGALANVDAKPQRTGKHIVFDSDADDDDNDDDEDEQVAVAASKKSLLQNSQSEDKASGEEEAAANNCHPIKDKGHLKKSGPQLFGSSEDEDEDGNEEEDQNRFDVRPQFEGPAGQKLMELQSRFGTDERFRMDSRFLEEEVEEDADMVEAATVEVSEEKTNLAADDDQALQEEKKRNMSILHKVLGLHPPTGKTKTFRDVTALHYDPSKEEHAAFETKTERIKKNSKSARRKKREEAQKLPEVSKEIFYDVTGDLKAMFGQTNDAEEVKTNWDQVQGDVGGGGEDPEEPAPVTSLVLTDASAGKEDPSGFTFSFFGNDLETESEHTVPAEYKVESIQAAKVSWQQDPHLKDSSSEEEEVEKAEKAEEKEKSIPVPKITQEETPPLKDMFFFHLNDSRLLEGPQWFRRSSQLEQEREQWQERAMVLKEECRKKHRNALRKVKPRQKR
ncbi:nucleolar protein 8 [Nerophis ophidion]|uniref:nucleolar protein 8 n=1 Tax=Nerophis ophidion TaxID=159077 RepID=UPI002ADFA1C8|nr:nucleolar protein 8 [Nerophis ophidion]